MSPSVEEMKLVEKLVGGLMRDFKTKSKTCMLNEKWAYKTLEISLTNRLLNIVVEHSREVVTDNQAT